MKFKLNRYPSPENPKPILEPRKDIPWEAKAVFNPSVIFDNGVYRMLYRAYTTDLTLTTPRYKRPGYNFANQQSYIGYAESTDGINFVRRDTPAIPPGSEFDKFACEDPRISKIDDIFYITYTSISLVANVGSVDTKALESRARIALATTKDFVTFKKHGVVGPPISSKAGTFFPEKLGNGKIGFIMTVSPDSTNSSVVVRYFDSVDEIFNQTDESWNKFLENSEENAVLKTEWWLHRGPELGATPVKTKEGWLLIFSNESMSSTWTVGAALLDLSEPHKLISRTSGYILQPVTDYEINGLVPIVTFPEGAVVVGDELFVYYGCADTVIGLATCKLDDLLSHILSFKHEKK